MAQKKSLYRIWDKEKQEYITTGSYRKKHSWLVFPWDAIGTNPKLFDDRDNRYEVHEFELKPVRKYDLKKNLITPSVDDLDHSTLPLLP